MNLSYFLVLRYKDKEILRLFQKNADIKLEKIELFNRKIMFTDLKSEYNCCYIV